MRETRPGEFGLLSTAQPDGFRRKAGECFALLVASFVFLMLSHAHAECTFNATTSRFSGCTVGANCNAVYPTTTTTAAGAVCGTAATATPCRRFIDFIPNSGLGAKGYEFVCMFDNATAASQVAWRNSVPFSHVSLLMGQCNSSHQCCCATDSTPGRCSTTPPIFTFAPGVDIPVMGCNFMYANMKATRTINNGAILTRTADEANSGIDRSYGVELNPADAILKRCEASVPAGNTGWVSATGICPQLAGSSLCQCYTGSAPNAVEKCVSNLFKAERFIRTAIKAINDYGTYTGSSAQTRINKLSYALGHLKTKFGTGGNERICSWIDQARAVNYAAGAALTEATKGTGVSPVCDLDHDDDGDGTVDGVCDALNNADFSKGLKATITKYFINNAPATLKADLISALENKGLNGDAKDLENNTITPAGYAQKILNSIPACPGSYNTTSVCPP